MVAIVIPLLDEILSLQLGVTQVFSDLSADLDEVIIVIGPATTPDSRAMAQTLVEKHGAKIRIISEKHQGLGGALQAGFDAATSPIVVTLFADMESDPHDVKFLVAAAKQHPQAIISASRWLTGGGLEQYSRGKAVLNWLGQWYIRRLFGSTVTDFTFGFRAYPSVVLKNRSWQTFGHDFVLESILRSIGEGIEVIEIPSRWRKRTEGRMRVWRSEYVRSLLFATRLFFTFGESGKLRS